MKENYVVLRSNKMLIKKWYRQHRFLAQRLLYVRQVVVGYKHQT